MLVTDVGDQMSENNKMLVAILNGDVGNQHWKDNIEFPSPTSTNRNQL